jgi:putative transcriptional regulator
MLIDQSVERSLPRYGGNPPRQRDYRGEAAKIDYVESASGQLLIAGPQLIDPNFWRTVVLVVEHTDEGALGLVLNRPAEATVGDAVPRLSGLIDDDSAVMLGGPVGQNAVIVLAEFQDPDEAALLAFENIGVLAGDEGDDLVDAPVQAARAFAGHAGWGPGQLEAEIERGDWILEPARRADAFAAEPDELWAKVLTRKGGSYALVARMPPDPSMN